MAQNLNQYDQGANVEGGFAVEEHHHHHHHHRHHHHQDGEGAEVQLQQQQQHQAVEQTISSNVLTVDTGSSKQALGVQPTSSFHSVSSVDSSAEMSKYFPDAQTPDSSPFRHHQEAEGGTQSTTATSTAATATSFNAGPYVPVPAPTAAAHFLQQQTVRQSIMSQQQGQPPAGARLPPGIPSYSSQIEGLSVSQAVVNDVLVDLQSKVINESVQQFIGDSSSGNYLEPLPPIYIRAPQPTIILRSDLNRLRAELGNRVRPPVVYRHPHGAAQQQQFHQFQQNNFQVPRFPAPRSPFGQSGSYGQYQNAPVFHSDAYQTTSTGESSEPLVNQIVNANDVHRPSDLQGLSAASFNRHASSSQFPFNIDNSLPQQQGDNETVFAPSSFTTDDDIQKTDNMFSRPVRPRQEISYDLNDCIIRCFEAHRQRVSRRRAARQARRARRQGQRQPQQQSFYNNQYQTYPPLPLNVDQYSRHFETAETRPSCCDYLQQTQRPPSANYYSTTGPPIDYSSISRTDDQSVYVSTPYDAYTGQTTTSQAVYPPQGSYVQPGAFEYTRDEYSTTSPLTSLPAEVQHLPSDYYQQQQQQETQYPLYTETPQQQTSFDYANYATTAYSPPEIHTQATEHRQAYDIPTQSSQIHDTHLRDQRLIGAGVPTGTFEYSTTSGTTYSQPQIYTHGTEHRQQYDIPIESSQIRETHLNDQRVIDAGASTGTFDYSTAAYSPPEIHTQATEHRQTYDIPTQSSQIHDTHLRDQRLIGAGVPTGTFEYSTTSGTTYSQPEIYTHGTEYRQQYDIPNESSQIHETHLNDQRVIDVGAATDTFDYSTAAYSPPEIHTQATEHRQTYDIPTQSSQIQGSQFSDQRLIGAGVPTGTFEYSRESYYSQEPLPSSHSIEQTAQQEQFSTSLPTYDFSTATDANQGDFQLQWQPTTVHQPESISYAQDTTQIHYDLPSSPAQEQTYTVDNYLQRLESESNARYYQNNYPEEIPTSTGGQLQSSFEQQTTTPFNIEQYLSKHIQEGDKQTQTYDLRNYTNEQLVHEQPQQPLYEEDQQRLLHRTADIISSLPSIPAAEEITQQHESIATATSEFPPPPTPDYRTYQTSQQQQRPGRSHTSIVPSVDKPNIYAPPLPSPQIPPSDTDDSTGDDEKEDEEIFDLRACIARCYAKHKETWDHDERRRYDEQVTGIDQPSVPIPDTIVPNAQYAQKQEIREQSNTSVRPCDQQLIQQSTAILSISCDHKNQQPEHFESIETRFRDASTQTPSGSLFPAPAIQQYAQEQTIDHTPYIPSIAPLFESDTRGQQTIEYSPPLITQTRHVLPTLPQPAPLPQYEWKTSEQQQQQPPLPSPPYLPFKETDHQSHYIQPPQYQNIPDDYKPEQQQQQERYRAYSEPPLIQPETTILLPPPSSQVVEQIPRRAISIPMIHQRHQPQVPPVRLLDNGRSYAVDERATHRYPLIDARTGLCLVPCPETIKYAHLPPHLRPELFCVELPPPSLLPPPPPPRPAPVPQKWCIKCCCKPYLIRKIVFKLVEEEKHAEASESYIDYGSVIHQMGTRVSVRHGNDIMEHDGAFVSGGYNEQLRIIDFPVYISGKDDPNLTPLVPVN